jgi:ATP-dependent Clp protease ATP-binding subunit ClpC
LTEDAFQVFAAAIRIARRNGQEYLGTDHLLLGITEAGPTPAGEALERAGITPAALWRQYAPSPGMGSVSGPLPVTPRARRVFEAALREANRRVVGEVDSLGLLVALSREADGIAYELLARVSATTVSAGRSPA